MEENNIYKSKSGENRPSDSDGAAKADISPVIEFDESVTTIEDPELFRTIFDSINIGVAVSDIKGNLIAFNERFHKMFGFERDEFYWQRLRDFMHPDDIEIERNILRESIATKRDKYAFETRILQKEGGFIWCRANVMIIRDPDEAPRFMVGAVEEITDRKAAENEIISLKKQMEFILGATQTGLDIIDTEFNIKYIDPEWGKKYGDPAGRKCYEYFMNRTEACPGCGIVKAFETKQSVVTEETLARENNRIIQVTSIPYQSEDGEWLAAEVNVDITQLKQAEEALRKSEDRFRALFEQSRDAIFIADAETGIIIDANKQAEILLMKSKKEIIGIHQSELHPNDNTDKHINIFEKFVKNEVSDGFQTEVITSNGVRVPVEIHSSMVTIEGGKKVVQGLFRDITERKLAEGAIRASEEKFRAIFDSAIDGITVVDLKGNIVETNEATAQMYGTSDKTELIGRNAFDHLNIEDAEKTLLYIPEAIEKGVIKSLELTALRKDGSEFPAEVSVSVMKDKTGAPAGFIAITKDITERKKTQDALRESEEKLRAMFDSAVDSITVVDMEGNITDVNEATVRMHGAPDKESLIGKSAFVLIKQEEVEKAIQLTPTTLRDGVISSFVLTAVRTDG
ncbi:MAG: PAS domain S-box protein, partial [bacterium]